MQVRRVREAEWRQLRRIRLAALRESPAAFASTWAREAELADEEWHERARLEAAGDNRVLFLAPTDDDDFVGVAGGYRPGRAPADAEVISIWVAPPARHGGLGRQLLDAVVGWACDGGARVVGLWVTRGNEAATALYQAAGFTATDEVQPLPSDPCMAELRMLLRVADLRESGTDRP